MHIFHTSTISKVSSTHAYTTTNETKHPTRTLSTHKLEDTQTNDNADMLKQQGLKGANRLQHRGGWRGGREGAG